MAAEVGGRCGDQPTGTVAAAADSWAAALAADPWQHQIPVVLRGRVDHDERGWTFTDTVGEPVAVHGVDLDLWRLLALTAGTVVDGDRRRVEPGRVPARDGRAGTGQLVGYLMTPASGRSPTWSSPRRSGTAHRSVDLAALPERLRPEPIDGGSGRRAAGRRGAVGRCPAHRPADRAAGRASAPVPPVSERLPVGARTWSGRC